MRLQIDNHRLTRELIISLLKSKGRKFDKCEFCSRDIKGKYYLHHTKYDGATIYDLKIICPTCDKLDVNRNLK